MAPFPTISRASFQIPESLTLFNSLLHSDLGDNELRLLGWENLKQRAPIGPLNIPKMMQEIEQESLNNGKPLVDHVDALFNHLTEKLRPDFEATQFPGEALQLTEVHLTALQARLQKRYEDEALQTIWNRKLRPLFEQQGAFQHVAPPDGIEAIRAWLNNPANKGRIQHVRDLNLSSLEIRALPSEIELFTGLQSLNLNNNQLSFLPESIGNLIALTELDLSDNQLSFLPESIGNLIALTDLELSGNQLSYLPESFGNLSALTGLGLWANQLRYLPESFGDLIALTDLELSNNQLSSLPESFGNLSALIMLDLSKNQLSSLPDSIGNLIALTELDLSGNQLSSLPDSIGNLQALTMLHLPGNQLRSLPDSISHLTALTWLCISGSQLIFLPESFDNLSALTTLALHGNPLMLVSDKECEKIRDYQTYLSLLEPLKKYAPQSPLAILFHAIIFNKPTETIQEAYAQLSQEMQHQIADLVTQHRTYSGSAQSTAESSSSDPSPIQDSLFTDMGLFAHSVRKSTYALYDSLEPEQKKLVHFHIWDLAGRPETDDSNWGQHHAFDHVLRFTDALERATQSSS